MIMGMNATPVGAAVFKTVVPDLIGKLGSTPRHFRKVKN